MEKNNILVPTDFSMVSRYALLHALHIAQASDSTLTLLHAVKKSHQISGAKVMLYALAEEAYHSHGIEIQRVVRQGNLLESISEINAEVATSLMVLGSNGKKVRSIWKKKRHQLILHNSAVPCLMVQEKEKEPGYHRILIPVDAASGAEIPMQAAAELARTFQAEIHFFCCRPESGARWKSIRQKLIKAGRFLHHQGVNIATEMAEGKLSFEKELLGYANFIGADLISLPAQEGGGSWPQSLQTRIISNSSVQALVVNPT